MLLMGEGAGGAAPAYIEDVFSTWLYTGTGSAITVTNGINLSANGGMVWLKNRNSTGTHQITDTARGVNRQIDSTSSSPQTTLSSIITAFNTTGFTLGTNAITNTSSNTYASWTWREKSNFFDVVTYTGTGANRTISHNLGSTPGCIIVKRTDGTNSDWFVYHRSLTSAAYRIRLDSTGIETSVPTAWNSTAPTSTVFSLGTATEVNENGGTYVAYLFAHNAGGFGLTGTDNVISCGSFSWSGSSAPAVNLGYEPQWLLVKPINQLANWTVSDTMRGLLGGTGNQTQNLFPNSSNAESNTGTSFDISATGFQMNGGGPGDPTTYIYIAIRRGPMKVPTDATKVFAPLANTTTTQTTNFTTDAGIVRQRDGANGWSWGSRLVGYPYLESNSTSAEFTSPTNAFTWQSNTQYTQNLYAGGSNNINYAFDRAPGFFDVVCYTGTGGTGSRNIAHNLTVVPQLLIIKQRSTTGTWIVYNETIGAGNRLILSGTNASGSTTSFASTTPTASVFTVDAGGTYNISGTTFISYLFATCAGVSKVGSYTGTGALQTVDCGFTGGARFVLIKRTNSTGDWWVYDSARGITSGNDPYLFINSSAAEVTNTNYVDADATGFKVTAAAPAGLNASGGTYIFLAIA